MESSKPTPRTNVAVPHHQVIHAGELLKARQAGNRIATWVTDALTSVLGSFIVFVLCFTVPLLAVPASTAVKLIVGIAFSNWFQAWALPVLQRSQNKTQAQNDAKADVDHKTLTYLAHLQDEQMQELKNQSAILEKLNAKDNYER